jgi:hypothetical protein
MCPSSSLFYKFTIFKKMLGNVMKKEFEEYPFRMFLLLIIRQKALLIQTQKGSKTL